MINKTTNYEIFKFREDNREKIDKSHIEKLKQSIASKNMLDLCPIIVNAEMEIIDGQHRFLAAKSLGIEIYYKQQANLIPEDIIRMNISKSWGMNDYLNFHCQHQKDSYLKLREFMKKHNISLKVALNISLGRAKEDINDFKIGKFEFKDVCLDTEMFICWETINFIKRMNGFSPYTQSTRFWNALLKLVSHPEFDEQKWRTNLYKMVGDCSTKSNTKNYISMLLKIYNNRNHNKIDLNDDE